MNTEHASNRITSTGVGCSEPEIDWFANDSTFMKIHIFRVILCSMHIARIICVTSRYHVFRYCDAVTMCDVAANMALSMTSNKLVTVVQVCREAGSPKDRKRLRRDGFSVSRPSCLAAADGVMSLPELAFLSRMSAAILWPDVRPITHEGFRFRDAPFITTLTGSSLPFDVADISET